MVRTASSRFWFGIKETAKVEYEVAKSLGFWLTSKSWNRHTQSH